MKPAILCALIVLSSFPFLASGQNTQNDIPFTYKAFRNLAFFFDSKRDLVDFFDFKPGEVIADVGAGVGKHEGAFSLLFDSLQFYIEDIDAKLLNEASLHKSMRHYARLRGKALTNTFQIRIGTETQTNLPDSLFDKIIIISAFHEFSAMDAMIDDLSRKLKPGGKIYIVDAVCYMKGHANCSAEQAVAKMKAHGFVLRHIDTTNRSGSEGLYRAVFAR